MISWLHTLFLVLLAVTVGAAALIYYLRKRGGDSYAKPGLRLSKGAEDGTLVSTLHEEPPSALSTGDREETKPHNLVATEELDRGQLKGDQRPSKSRNQDEVPIRTNRDNLVSGPFAGDGLADPTAGGTEDSGASPKEVDVTGDDDPARDQKAQEEVKPVQSADEDKGPTGIAETGAAVVSEESDRVSGQDAAARTEVPPEAMSAAGATDADEMPGAATEGDECSSGPEDERNQVDTNIMATQDPRKKRSRTPPTHRYQGLVRTAPQIRGAEPQPSRAGDEDPADLELSLPIQVRLRFNHDGFCDVSLIAKRSAGLPEDLTVSGSAGEVTLRAMQDEWYQDVVPDDISRLLRDGTVWTQEGANGQCRWSLSGRTLYVLADRPDISGYVSQPCLELGRSHVVLCSEPVRSRVEEAILETGAQPATVLDESFGGPPGWVVLRDVVPNTPVAPSGEVDIFNALRPLPGIKIRFERGIRLKRGNWLDGYPPSIRVYGDPEHAAEVRIDDQVAACDADGTYRAPGWHTVGSHSVWCSGTSRSYSIVPFEVSWELWEAYAFPAARSDTGKLTICGPIVRAASAGPCGTGASIAVPETNPVLLGPEPGQIAMAVRASSLRGAPRIASPCFRPIWALPRDPLHCDKETTRIVLVAGTDAPATPKEPGVGQVTGAGANVGEWYRLILDANRKGMKTNPETESVRALWFSYKRLARRIWRAHR